MSNICPICGRNIKDRLFHYMDMHIEAVKDFYKEELAN